MLMTVSPVFHNKFIHVLILPNTIAKQTLLNPKYIVHLQALQGSQRPLSASKGHNYLLLLFFHAKMAQEWKRIFWKLKKNIFAKQFITIQITGYESTITGSPGLVVMGGDSFPKVVGSNPGAVYWMVLTFFTYIRCKNCNVCLKIRK